MEAGGWLFGHVLRAVPAFPVLWQSRTRLNCYSEPPSTSRSTETRGWMARMLIPDGVCLWLTLTTMINIQDNNHCCRRRIYLTIKVIVLSFLLLATLNLLKWSIMFVLFWLNGVKSAHLTSATSWVLLWGFCLIMELYLHGTVWFPDICSFNFCGYFWGCLQAVGEQ